MSGAVRYFKIDTRPRPVLPEACESGGCGGTQEPREAPASFGEVSVDGVEIEPEAIAREMQHHPAASGEIAWQAAARALVLRELMLREARRLGLPAEPEEEGGARETPEDALVRRLLELRLSPARAGEAECRRYYDGHAERFRTPELFEASHILIEPQAEDEAAWEAAKARAHALVAELGDDPTAFAEAARKFSGCPTAQQGGSLGQVRRGELAAPVQAALEALPEGGTSMARSRFGWHVLRLSRRLPGRTLPFELVREKIADMLEARAWTVAAARYAAELAAQADVQGVLIDPTSA